MKILLPPSETKREGGDGPPLDLDALALPALGSHRSAVLDALVDLAADESAARRVLKLSDRQTGDIAHNRRLRTSPTMPAVDRYTGVLFDALDARTLPAASRRWLATHVWIHSAPLGPVGALDPLPAYRLAAGTSLPGLPALRRHWSAATTSALADAAPSFVLDLRSEAYVALGPVPATVPSVYVRVVTEQGRALNHFNKKSKGLLVRALAQDKPRTGTLRGFRSWAQAHGIVFRDGEHSGVVELVVTE
ncbi:MULTISPECIES: YaaA family protein [unclassified Microbacterium]|uniref:YaaA family protein n=1 Tax=unclassified Microbacterium TaxID=2609290 RepID=UPI0016054023|nr:MULTISPECIES: peroxide stress protein YaaA [unclassified Microbacterium]QNA92399.1 peroxide stress protein YaaA [Microbacterium sp. Se63.02b]QYM65688.1 peroxide stress protein YaaA [Microbacterium sp. Se5.02b]